MLNKFVRLAGDILLQILYISYVDMLTSLSNNEQASSYCFRLLSRNDRSGSFSICWDHFFSSLKQYYTSLRSTPDALGRLCRIKKISSLLIFAHTSDKIFYVACIIIFHLPLAFCLPVS